MTIGAAGEGAVVITRFSQIPDVLQDRFLCMEAELGLQQVDRVRAVEHSVVHNDAPADGEAARRAAR